MKPLFLLCSFVFLATTIFAQSKTATVTPYKFTVNLEKVTDDKLTVELQVPPLPKNKMAYYIPKIVPGTYAIYDFGKFVENFKAFDKKGKEISTKHPDPNTWIIKCSKECVRITYEVNDSWDADATKFKPLPFEPAGSNIEAGKNTVLNTHAFFGYFEGMTKVPYEVTVKRPSNFFGATSLTRTGGDATTDVFAATSYNALADGPIMFCQPDTAMLRVGNADVLISVYSPTGKVKAAFVATQIKPTLNAQMQYLGGKLPVDKYAFIIYLTDGYTATGSYGALEHSYSSFYVLPETEPESIAQTVRDVAAHEFFHVVTPLAIHAEEIADFDFINPKMSKHLWLYEGTTEYKASHVQVKYGMMPLEKYVEVLGDKIRESLTTKTKEGKLKYDDNLSFTEMSKDVLVKYKEQYNNVYAKGTLIGACLDILLNKNSRGKYNLNLLMDDLAKEYGVNKAFKDDELFDKIITLSKMPNVKPFFDTYVAGNGHPLPLKETFASVGIDYYAKHQVKDLTIGGLEKCLGFDPATKQFFVATEDNFDDFGDSIGFKEKDVLLQWNGIDLTMDTIDEAIGGFAQKMKAGMPFTVTVQRDGKPLTLKAVVKPVLVEKEHVLELTPNPTPAQLELRNWWLGDKVVREPATDK